MSGGTDGPSDPPPHPANSISIQYVSVRIKPFANNPAERSLLSLPSAKCVTFLMMEVRRLFFFMGESRQGPLHSAEGSIQEKLAGGELFLQWRIVQRCFHKGWRFNIVAILSVFGPAVFSCLPCWRTLELLYLCFGARTWISARSFNYISRLMSWHLFFFLNRKLGGIRGPERFFFCAPFSKTFHLKMRRSRVTAVVRQEYLYLLTSSFT